MNRSSLFYFAALSVLILTDVLSKGIAMKSGHYWANPGVILGFLRNLPPYLTVLALSALSGFLFVAFSLLILFLSTKLHGLKLGLTSIVGGIFGNVFDKALRGWTIDFIPFPWFGGTTVAFNFADVFLWVGIAIVFWFLTHKEDQIWFPGNQRQLLFAHTREQYILTGQLVVLIMGPCMMMVLFSTAFIRRITQVFSIEAQSTYLWQYFSVCLCLGLLFFTLAIVAGLWWSHRLLGPVLAFNRHVDKMIEGEDKEFILRQGDRLKMLEDISKKLKSFFVLALFWPLTGYSYPQYIGLQYTSCLTCHYNPNGNGPLNDYGRGVAATTISGRLLVSDQTTEEQLISRAAFPGINPKTNSWLRPALMYRVLGIDRGAFSGDSEKNIYQMQLDANVVLKAGDRNQYVMSFTQGLRPKSFADANNLREGRGYSREHYIGWRPTAKVGVYVGKMDKAFGIRIPDHNLSSRRINRVAQYDQVHGVLLHTVLESFEGSLHYFVGDQQRKDRVGRANDDRDKGFTGTFEVNVFERSRLGASYMSQETKTIRSSHIAVHDRIGFGKGHSVMAEIGQKSSETIANGTKIASRWGLLQTHLMMGRGFFVQGTLDYLRADIDTEDETVKAGPGIQWFPRQKIELRLDLYNSRSFLENAAPKDTFEVLGQVHLWL